MISGRAFVVLVLVVLAWAGPTCPLSAAPVGVPATLLPDPAQLFSEPFDLGPDNPTVELEFVPVKPGSYSAVAVWDGEDEVQMRVGDGQTQSGHQGLVQVFAGKEGEPVVIRLSLGATDQTTVTSVLTVLYGVEDAASNRPFKPTLPGRLLPPVTDLDSRDALLPIFIHLTERYLGAAPDSNELDLVFAAAVERNPGLTRPYLRAMVRQ